MAENFRKIVLVLLTGIFVFWVAFRSGEIYGRIMKIPKEARSPSYPPELYYIIVTQGGDTAKNVSFYVEDDRYPIVKFFLNKKTRGLLKEGDVKIYDGEGRRIF